MNIAFICNQNQARSQVLSSVFASLLSSSEFSSFGLIAREGTPLPIVIESVFYDWGLDPTGRFAKNMGLHWDEILNMEIVIAVTSFIAEEVKTAGFRGVIIDLEQESNRLGIAVVDPQLMPRRQCAFELAKYLKVAVSAFQGVGVLKKSPYILALLPEDEAAIDKAASLAIAEGKGSSSVIFGDLIAPASSLQLESNANTIKFKVSESAHSVELLGTPEGPAIYLPKSAALHPAKVYLSESWQSFILKMASDSLIIVTPPQKNSTGKLAESYLSALYADEIRLVRA
jgi:protein-tyrosine-phosphatase